MTALTFDVVELASPGGNAEPVAINVNGYSVGADRDGPTLWSPSGQATVLNSSSFSGAIAINSHERSIGNQPTGNGSEALSWSETGRPTFLVDVGGEGNSHVSGINNHGDSVGSSVVSPPGATFQQEAVLWAPNGTATVLEDIPGDHDAAANAINNNGQIVGESGYFVGEPGTGYEVSEAVFWAAVGSNPIVLQNVGGGHSSNATAINSAGQSIGVSELASGDGWDAVLWSASGAGTVLDDVGGENASTALALASNGVSVGYSAYAATNGQGREAVRWSADGAATVLQAIDGSEQSEALALGGNGMIVGFSGAEAALWNAQGHVTDLGAILGSGWSDTEATAINASDQIVGFGFHNGVVQGFLLTPSTT